MTVVVAGEPDGVLLFEPRRLVLHLGTANRQRAAPKANPSLLRTFTKSGLPMMGMAIAPDRIILNLSEMSGNVWMDDPLLLVDLAVRRLCSFRGVSLSAAQYGSVS